MAAIAPSRIALLLLLAFAASAPAQHSRAIENQIARVGTALAARNAEEAMIPFDKSFDGYSRLNEYFAALTNAYSISNDLEITDETIVSHEATVTVHWIMTLSDLQSGLSETRQRDLTVKVSLKKHDWKIVSIAPIEFLRPRTEIQTEPDRGTAQSIKSFCNSAKFCCVVNCKSTAREVKFLSVSSCSGDSTCRPATTSRPARISTGTISNRRTMCTGKLQRTPFLTFRASK